MKIRRLLTVTGIAGVLVLASAGQAGAHQPVPVGPGDRTAATGPLLVDGTVSYAVYANVSGKQTRGFRFGLKSGDRMQVDVLIVDKAPGNTLAARELPEVVITDPKGQRTVLRPTERTPFVEGFTGTKYLYVARTSRPGIPGTYAVLVRSRSASKVETVVAVGYREVHGNVVR